VAVDAERDEASRLELHSPATTAALALAVRDRLAT
jgi:hypothetical protein